MGVMFDGSELNALAADLGDVAATIGKKGSAAVRKTAFDIEATSKAFAPVDTGNLRNSISSDITGDGRFNVISAEIGPTAEYGHHVEFGTSVMAPAAYMGPAFDRHAWQLEAALQQLGAEGIV